MKPATIGAHDAVHRLCPRSRVRLDQRNFSYLRLHRRIRSSIRLFLLTRDEAFNREQPIRNGPNQER